MGKEKTMVLKLTPNMHVINFLSYFVVYFAPTLVLGYRFFFAQKPLSLSFLILFYAACLLCGEYCFWNYWHSEITKQKKHKSWLWSINVKEPNFWIFAYVIIQDFLIEGFIIYTVFQWNVPFVKIFFILSSVKLLGGMIQYLGWNNCIKKNEPTPSFMCRTYNYAYCCTSRALFIFRVLAYCYKSLIC